MDVFNPLDPFLSAHENHLQSFSNDFYFEVKKFYSEIKKKNKFLFLFLFLEVFLEDKNKHASITKFNLIQSQIKKIIIFF